MCNALILPRPNKTCCSLTEGWLPINEFDLMSNFQKSVVINIWLHKNRKEAGFTKNMGKYIAHWKRNESTSTSILPLFQSFVINIFLAVNILSSFEVFLAIFKPFPFWLFVDQFWYFFLFKSNVGHFRSK